MNTQFTHRESPWEKKRPGHWTRTVEVNGVQVREKLFGCMDCDQNPLTQRNYLHLPMVHDHLWREHVGTSTAGQICVPCFEKRMGRRLTPEDLKVGPGMNAPWLYSKSDW